MAMKKNVSNSVAQATYIGSDDAEQQLINLCSRVVDKADTLYPTRQALHLLELDPDTTTWRNAITSLAQTGCFHEIIQAAESKYDTADLYRLVGLVMGYERNDGTKFHGMINWLFNADLLTETGQLTNRKETIAGQGEVGIERYVAAFVMLCERNAPSLSHVRTYIRQAGVSKKHADLPSENFGEPRVEVPEYRDDEESLGRLEKEVEDNFSDPEIDNQVALRSFIADLGRLFAQRLCRPETYSQMITKHSAIAAALAAPKKAQRNRRKAAK